MNHILADLKQLIEIPSVVQAAKPHQPFGEPIDQVLDEMLALCQREGWQTFKDPDGYYGYAQIGSSEEVFGILCHLDVVPAGTLSEWNNPPFRFYQDETHVYGRGVSDDKGPTLIAFHALLDLIKQGYQPKQTIRFIFGTDEENGWACINKYKQDGQLIPSRGFVPDGSFPLTYAEKGLWQVWLVRHGHDELRLTGGVAMNVVPGEAWYDQPSEALIQMLRANGCDFEIIDNRLRVIGKNAHSASAPTGKNALVELLRALHQMGVDSQIARFVSDKLVAGVNGEKLFERRSDEVSGDMTINLGLVDITPTRQALGLDIRHPVTIDKAYFQSELAKQANAYGFILEERDYLAPLYIDVNSDLVQKLLGAYRTITQDMTEPLISGGATYARSMDNFVAFGAALPGAEETEHQPNERLRLQDMQIAYDIYQEAFKRLVMEEQK